MTLKSLHDHHITRLAWPPRRSRAERSGDEYARSRTALKEPNCLSPTKPWEKWMKLVKTSAVAVAISALLVGPVLAQGASSGTQVRGGAQGKTQMQGGTSGSMDEDATAPAGAANQRAGAKTGMKGTVGAGSGAKATGGAATPPATGR
jgi:hypothetical protein